MSVAPFFTVIVTIYNRSEFLKRTIDSLKAQKEDDFEVIVIDDGSENEVVKLIQQLIRNDDRFLFYPNGTNHGTVFSKNRGIQLARGKYITFLDSDDEYLPNHLSSRKEILIQNPTIAFLYGGVKVIGDQFVPDVENEGQLIPITACVASGTFFIHQLAFIELPQFECPEIASDLRFFQQIQTLNQLIVKTEIPTYIYHREHDSSITKNESRKM